MKMGKRIAVKCLLWICLVLLAVGEASAAVTDLEIVANDDVDPVTAGTDLTYMIVVFNSGPEVASPPTWSAEIPSGTTFALLGPFPGWSCDTPPIGSGGSILCNSSSFLPPGPAAVFPLIVHVSPSTPDGSIITLAASVFSPDMDPNPFNNSSLVTTSVRTETDLSVAKMDTPDPVLAGDKLSYTIVLSSNGPSNAGGVTLSDTLPAGTKFFSLSSPPGWSCSTPAVGSGGAISCSSASVAVDIAEFTLVVNVDPTVAHGTVINNTVTVSSVTFDPNSGNDTASTSTTVNVVYSVTGVVKNNSGGGISCQTPILHNGSSTCWLTIDPGWHVSELLDNGGDVLAVLNTLDNTYALANIVETHTVEVTYQEYPVRRLTGDTTNYFDSIKASFKDALPDDIIRVLGTAAFEYLTYDQPVSVTLEGGFVSGFGSSSGATTINELQIISGTLSVDRITIL